MRFTMKKLSVFYLTNIPTPYRLSFLNSLSDYVDLNVCFESKYALDRDKSWKNIGEIKFSYEILKGVFVTKDSRFCPSIVKAFNKKKYDLVVIAMYSTPTSIVLMKYLSKHKIPFIISSDGGFPDYSNGLKKNIKVKLMSLGKYWLSTGRITTQYLQSLGANGENIYVYPFSSVFQREILSKEEREKLYFLNRKEFGIQPNDYIIVSIGQMIYRKGFDLLIKASELFDFNFKIYIIGGKPNKEITDFCEINDKIEFVDFCKKDQIYKYLTLSDLFVFPTREDIWGLVINEAMAVGLPVITTDMCIAGTEMIKENVNGKIIRSNDYKELASAVNYAHKHFNFVNEDSLDVAKKYTIETMAKTTYQIFLKIFNLEYGEEA